MVRTGVSFLIFPKASKGGFWAPNVISGIQNKYPNSQPVFIILPSHLNLCICDAASVGYRGESQCLSPLTGMARVSFLCKNRYNPFSTASKTKPRRKTAGSFPGVPVILLSPMLRVSSPDPICFSTTVCCLCQCFSLRGKIQFYVEMYETRTSVGF